MVLTLKLGITLALVTFISALVQSTSGFGFGILSMAILPFFFPYRKCTVIVVATVLILQLYTIISMRKHLKWKMVLYPAVASLICGFIGVHMMVRLSSRTMGFILGFFMWVLALYLIFGAKYVHLKRNPLVGSAAGALGGFMDGMFAIGGPPMVAYFDSVMDDPLEYQVTLQLYFAITTVNVLINNIACGNFTAQMTGPLCITIVACVIGTTIGMRIMHHVSMKFVRRMAYIVMLAAGTYHLLQGFGIITIH